jgi:hypothetical protein
VVVVGLRPPEYRLTRGLRPEVRQSFSRRELTEPQYQAPDVGLLVNIDRAESFFAAVAGILRLPEIGLTRANVNRHVQAQSHMICYVALYLVRGLR